MVKKLICLLIMISFNLNAEVRSLNKGDIAPYTGFLFSSEAEAKVRLKVELYDTQSRYIELYKQENDLLKQQSNLWQKQSMDLSKQVFKSNDSFWSRFGIFLMGAGTAIAIGYTIKETYRR